VPPVPSLEFPVFGLAGGCSGWRSVTGWSSPGSFHQITLAHGDGAPPTRNDRSVAGLITVTTDRKGLAELNPDSGLGRPGTELRHVLSSAFVGLSDRVSMGWAGSERGRRSWLKQFHNSETHTRVHENWLPTTLSVDGEWVPGLFRTAQGQTAVIAERDEVFLTVECDEGALGELQIVEVTADIGTYVSGRAALLAMYPD
jgi:hypothetical protein